MPILARARLELGQPLDADLRPRRPGDGADRRPEEQTRDIARYQDHWYTDKTPGFSVAAIPPYWLAKTPGRLPDHPLDRAGFAHWPADYWVTLGTSGLATALTAAILASLARRLGCAPRAPRVSAWLTGWRRPRRSTPTLAYGHQLAAFGLFAAFGLLAVEGRRVRLRAALAGFLAATRAWSRSRSGRSRRSSAWA